MLFKNGKERKDNLSDNQFVHSKYWFARLAEGLIVEEGLRDTLLENLSIYQIGGQPDHRPEK